MQCSTKQSMKKEYMDCPQVSCSMSCHVIFKNTMSLKENGSADRGILDEKPMILIPKLGVIGESLCGEVSPA